MVVVVHPDEGGIDRVLAEEPPQLSEATSPQIAYEVAYMMKGVIDRGTAYAAPMVGAKLVLPGPGGADQPVAYLKRPVG